MNNAIKWAISLLMGATIFRAQTVLFLPTLNMFGGIVPNAWLAPWISDAVIGLLLPGMIYLFWTRRGVVLWVLLVTYNALGAFDYAHGLATQWTSPLPPRNSVSNDCISRHWPVSGLSTVVPRTPVPK